MIALDLTVQFEAEPAALTEELLQSWIQLCLEEIAHIYEQSQLSPPYQTVALTFRFCDEQEGRALNKQYRNKDYATNVLTFEYGVDPAGVLRGDIIVCVPVLEKEAQEQQKNFLHHAAHLCLHGTLHALGYDHLTDEDAEEMEELEIHLLQRLNISNPYQN